MEHLTDESLKAEIERKRSLKLPARYAETMLAIHPADRLAASLQASKMLNMASDAGRPSDALASVARQFRKA